MIECNLDMIPYIEGMAEAFKEHLPKGVIKTPVTKGMFISKNTVVSEQESKEVLNAGFQVAVGMLMWAVRMCYPGGKVAVSMMCRVMAKPSWEVFGEAMNLIAWLYQNRTVGIKFSKCGNTIPIGLVDASNKPDPSDGKAQFGGVIMFMGATVIDISRKLKHSGLSSAHNEYMAMYYVHQALVWFRQLVAEIGLQELIKKPRLSFWQKCQLQWCASSERALLWSLPRGVGLEVGNMSRGFLDYILSSNPGLAAHLGADMPEVNVRPIRMATCVRTLHLTRPAMLKLLAVRLLSLPAWTPQLCSRRLSGTPPRVVPISVTSPRAMPGC